MDIDFEQWEQELLKMATDQQGLTHTQQMLKLCQKFSIRQGDKARRMFGYPANLVELSPLTRYLLYRDLNSPLANNCGDNYEHGNYQMDTKDIERMIVDLFAKKFGAGDNYWGYITSGGSESNTCGIDMAFAKNPLGILYFSQSAHYSIVKHAAHYHCQVILDSDESYDKMDAKLLIKMAQANYESLGAPANIVLTFGTTKYGVCDDIDEIVGQLKSRRIPYYIHLDAALLGGIPNNQLDAPILTNMLDRGINSISVSLHKYIGFPDVKSVLLATEKPKGKFIPYIGHMDTTTSGSRSIPALALYNHIVEQLTLSPPDNYRKNIVIFDKMLKSENIEFFRAHNSNTFVIDAPSEEVARQFQLSCFLDNLGNNKAHIIIFPYHTEQNMQALVNRLKSG